ncbi:SARP family transcriptional regulator [Pseudofrankia sp. EUN1h]|nr:SARP family transcriptional regulator [Pseudofrankia sp. EUN1h]
MGLDVARFGALGPLEVSAADGTPVFIGQRKRRRLLSLLLLHAGSWVGTEQIGVALWEDDPPRSALGNIKTYVSELRHALPSPPPTASTSAGHDPPTAAHRPGRIASRDGEYAIRLAPGELDVDLFDAGARAGDDALAEGDPARAVRLLEQALKLWRGRPYDDLPADLAVAETARLEELRWNAWENLADARLRLGQHGLVLPALRALTIEHPTRERLWGQLLVALDQDGRRAEALRAYQAVYRTLTERLGIEPGEDLRALHQRILRGTGGPAATELSGPRPAHADARPAHAGPPPARRHRRGSPR